MISIAVTRRDWLTILHVAGELDHSSGRELEEQIARWSDRGRNEVALDLSDVTFMDGGGVRALVHAQERGEAFRIWKASRPVQRVLELLDQTHLAA